MKSALLLALLLAPCAAACKHSTSSSSASHTETSTTTESTSSETGTQTTVTTTSEAPGKTTTTVEEFSPPPPEEVMPSESERSGLRAVPDGGVPATPGVVSRPSHGPLVRRTVTVTERGAETTETHQQAVTQGTAATETKAEAKGDTKAQAQSASAPSAGCIGASWLWGLAALAFAGLLIFGAIRMRRAI